MAELEGLRYDIHRMLHLIIKIGLLICCLFQIVQNQIKSFFWLDLVGNTFFKSGKASEHIHMHRFLFT